MKLAVNVGKAKLLETVKANLVKHLKEYAESMEGWYDKLVSQLVASGVLSLDFLKQAKEGSDDAEWMKGINPSKLIPEDWHDEPVSFAGHYEDAIEMLALSTDEKITLSRTLFCQLVQDKWEWSDRHMHSNRKYSLVLGGVGRH